MINEKIKKIIFSGYITKFSEYLFEFLTKLRTMVLWLICLQLLIVVIYYLPTYIFIFGGFFLFLLLANIYGL